MHMHEHHDHPFPTPEPGARGTGEAAAPDPDATHGLSRRGFLAAAGFSIAGLALTGCERPPARTAHPFLTQPEGVTPGTALWYATTCEGCSAGCGALVKTRDGRPIKVEGLPEHPLSRGGLCAIGQALPIELYDSRRRRVPSIADRDADWTAVDAHVRNALADIAARGGRVRVLSGTVHSPTLLRSIDRFLAGFADGRHVMMDTRSHTAQLDAHEQVFGVRALPRYAFDRATAVAAFEADVLGTWISPVEYAAARAAARVPDGTDARMQHHAQVESLFTLSGGAADARLCVPPHEVAAALLRLETLIAVQRGWDLAVRTPALEDDASERFITRLASTLLDAGQGALVVCGLNDVRAQRAACLINAMLGAPGTTLDLAVPSQQVRGDDRAVAALREDLRARRVDALLLLDANPVHALPDGAAWADLLRAVPLCVSLSSDDDESAACASVRAPDHHPFERWSDAEPVRGLVSIAQPTLRPMHATRAASVSLWRWSAAVDAATVDNDARTLVRDTWRERVWPAAGSPGSFDTFFDETLARGFVHLPQPPSDAAAHAAMTARARAAARIGVPGPALDAPAPGASTLVLYDSVAMREPRHAHNPWLHELPDPVTKLTWENPVLLAPSTASRLGVRDGDLVRVRTGDGAQVTASVLAVSGIHPRCIGIALGYGRTGTDRFAGTGPSWLEARPTVDRGATVGCNAAPLLGSHDGYRTYVRHVSLAPAGGSRDLGRTQEHFSLLDPFHPTDETTRRPLFEETTLGRLRDAAGALIPAALGHGAGTAPATGSAAPAAGSVAPAASAGSPAAPPLPGNPPSMWPERDRSGGHRWAMAVDLTACTGCAACVVSCQVENNIPVVGRDEVRRNREMHWLRIDRYVDGEGSAARAASMPMLCQHCENAPCETVCPVLATVHSDEGLNQQVYNRCVGTRYCANNCPYKMRRFNWFDYAHAGPIERLALNPDVTVRERGVMEKCTFCVQRIEEGKIAAKRRGSPLRDGEIQPACAQSCPARAITFGDLNDPASRVRALAASPRAARALEELNVRPSVWYLSLVRNPGGEDRHG